MTSFLKIRRAAEVIRSGGVVAYPTEAVWGLGCDPLNADAVDRILALKHRSAGAGLILIAADPVQLTGFVDAGTDISQLASADDVVTWIVDAGPLASNRITGGRDTIAVRITRHPLSAALSLAAQTPIVSTSANRSGCAPARSALAVRCAFGDTIDAILPGATGGRLQPSEIRDARSGAVLRAG